MIDKDQITSTLLEKGLISNRNIDLTPLTGGVSSDLWVISDGLNKYVIKQARSRLKVKDNWYADISRNETEQEFILYVQKFLPKAVPKLLLRDIRQGYFAMEFLDHTFTNWKEQLLKGIFEPDIVRKSAELMAAIHQHSQADEEAQQTFNTTSNFRSLRIDPYLITTGNRHSNLKRMFYDEAERLENCREALVHGDFSPKNIMAGTDRLVLLDHEVAWYGDPAFDIAFLMSHFYLKMLLHYKTVHGLPDISQIFWKTYFEYLGDRKKNEMELRIGRLLLMLLLARVDGKSPVEYFGDAEKDFVRMFVYDLLPGKVYRQTEINSQWKSKLNKLPL